MSERKLPDDPADWPDDPYELLGIPHSISARDLKRTYARLIRQYKPEQHPEEFRRIRQAYEFALRIAELGIVFHTDAESPPADLPVAASAPAPARVADPAGELWTQAVDGDEPGAYAGLRELALREPARSDLSLRLYWLLRFVPKLDPDCDPAAWLVSAVRAYGTGTPAFELLRQDFHDRPDAALAQTDGFPEFGLPAESLAELTAARWQAAGSLKRWWIIEADLNRLRPILAQHHERVWLRLQFCAIDFAIWWLDDRDSRELFAKCKDEVLRLDHCAIQEQFSYDRFDYLEAVARDWRMARDAKLAPAALIDLGPTSWWSTFGRFRPAFVQLLDQIATRPRSWVQWLDALEQRAPMTLDYLSGLLMQYQDRLESPPAVPHAPEDLVAILGSHLAGQSDWSYGALRFALLDFCLEESVDVEMVAAVAPPHSIRAGGQAMPLPNALAGDIPLRLVCWACRLFWA